MDANISANAHLETRATGTYDERDSLTGVRGRYTLLNNYEWFADKEAFIALCDVDNFRMINDAYGENQGNEMLRRIGQAVQHVFGDPYTFRYGSDEFIIVSTSENEQTFLDKLKRLDREVAAISLNGQPLHLTCSYGYVHGRLATSEDLHEAIRFADRKMYEAKRLGKARAVGVSLKGDPFLAHGMHTHAKVYKSYEVDELTGLANLIHFRNELDVKMQARTPEAADPMAVVYFNVQNFKGYNERYGFDVGDELLVLIADAIESSFPNQLAARFSADQFFVLSTKSQFEDSIVKVRAAFRSHQKDSSIWLKAGIYILKDKDTDVGVVCDRAKLACDNIKGRRDVFMRVYDEELQRQLSLHTYVLDHFDEAIESGWIKIYYQPIVRVATGEVCDEEALARWVDPVEGILSPIDFIPVLEDARLIHRLDLYMVRRACENFARARRDGLSITPVSVNLSRLDFELCDIVLEVEKILAEFSVDRSMLSIEVTESALAGNQEFMRSEIDRFRADGFEVWMDDFGSGYSSLHLLKDYTFDLIKVDMGFLSGFDNNEEARVMLAHMISMAKELGIKTLVEGVETESQVHFLKGIGCGRAQGFYFGKPASLDEMEDATAHHAYLPVEREEKRSFYEAIGRVNLLRPDAHANIGGHYVPGDVPAAIIRRRDGVYKYLNASDVYLAFLESSGVKGLEESARRLNDPMRVEHIRLEEAVNTCTVSGDWEWATYFENGRYISLRVREIADYPERDAVAVLVIGFNVSANRAF